MELDVLTQEVLFDFTLMLMGDLEKNVIRPVEHYQARFPGYDKEISAEFISISRPKLAQAETGEDGDSSGPSTPGNPGGLKIGRFSIERELGRGGQAAVYAARDTRMDRSVALKVLSSTFEQVTEIQMARFRREADALANVTHPCICDIYEVDFQSDPAYIAMQLVEGETIRQHIHRATQVQSGESETGLDPLFPCFPETEEALFTLLRVFERLARALHAAHEHGVIHRDIKPANVIIDGTGVPVIVDFGLARLGGEEQSILTQTGEVFGTPAYMPPELLRGSGEEHGPSLDLYSLGVTLFECLTLKRPFDSEIPAGIYPKILEEDAPAVREFNPTLPMELDVVLSTVLEKTPDRRYSSTQDFAEELRRICEHEPIRATPAGPWLKLRRWVQRNPRLGISIASSILILALGLTVSLLLLQRVTTERDTKERLIELYKAPYLRERGRAMLGVDPTHALLLATEAFQRDPIEINHREIRRAMDMMFEVDRQRVPFQNFTGGSGFISNSAIHPTKPWVAYCDRFDNLWFRDHSTGQSKRIIEGPITESDEEVAKDHIHSSKVAFDAAGENLFVTRMGAETIEVRSADASEVRCELAVSGQTLRLLGQCATRALTAGWGKEDQIFRELRFWDVADGSLIFKVEPKDSLLRWARLSPDGARVAIGLTSTIGEAARVEIWNMELGQQVVQLGGNLGPSVISSDGRWSPSGERFFTCSRKSAVDGTEAAPSGATLWSLPGGEVVAELEHEDPCVKGAFSADGSTLATACSGSGVIRLWDGRTGALRHELEGHEDRTITSLDYSTESPHLLGTISHDQTARIWDVNTGASVAVFLGMASRLSYGGGGWIGERYMSLTEKGMLHQWSTGQQPWPRKVSVEAGDVQAVWFAESGQALLLSSDAGAISVQDWRTGERLASHAWGAILAEDMLVDDVRGAVTALTSGAARVVEWNWRTNVERTLSYAGPPLESIRPYAEGDARCLLENGSGDLEVWDLDRDEQLYVIHPSDQEARWLITESCSTRDLLATGAADGYLRIWNATTGALVRELGPFHPHNGDAQISDIVFSSDGMSIYAISRDARLRGWKVDSGEPPVERATHTAGHLAWVGEDHLLASAAYRGMLTLFESQGAMAKRTQIALGVQPGTFISVCKDGRHILYGDAKSAVQFLDASWLMASSKEAVTTQTRERARVGSFSINPHSEDQPDHFHAAVFSPDDQFILTVGDGKAWIWPADLLSAAREVMPVGPEFFGDLPSPSMDWEPVK